MSEVVSKWQAASITVSTSINCAAHSAPTSCNRSPKSAGLSVDDTLKHLADHLPGAAKSHFGA